MTHKKLEQLTKSLVEGDLTEKYDALRRLAIYKDESTVPFLQAVLFSEELDEWDREVRQKAKATDDVRETTAYAYYSYEIDILRHEIVKLLEEIGTTDALAIVKKWEEQERNTE